MFGKLGLFFKFPVYFTVGFGQLDQFSFRRPFIKFVCLRVMHSHNSKVCVIFSMCPAVSLFKIERSYFLQLLAFAPLDGFCGIQCATFFLMDLIPVGMRPAENASA